MRAEGLDFQLSFALFTFLPYCFIFVLCKNFLIKTVFLVTCLALTQVKAGDLNLYAKII